MTPGRPDAHGWALMSDNWRRVPHCAVCATMDDKQERVRSKSYLRSQDVPRITDQVVPQVGTAGRMVAFAGRVSVLGP
jgi:hypothetical protein